MKKIITLVSCMVVSFSLFSQNENTTTNNNSIASAAEQSVFSLGVHGSFGHSYITSVGDSKFDPSWGAGIAAIYAPWVHFGVETGVRYSAEGCRISTPLYGGTSSTLLQYIRVPVKAVYFVGPYANDFRPKFSIGPVIGFLTNEGKIVRATSVDFGATASVGFHYRVAKAIWFTTDLNFYQGFVDTFKITSDKNLNGNLRLDVGLNFGF